MPAPPRDLPQADTSEAAFGDEIKRRADQRLPGAVLAVGASLGVSLPTAMGGAGASSPGHLPELILPQVRPTNRSRSRRRSATRSATPQPANSNSPAAPIPPPIHIVTTQ